MAVNFPLKNPPHSSDWKVADTCQAFRNTEKNPPPAFFSTLTFFKPNITTTKKNTYETQQQVDLLHVSIFIILLNQREVAVPRLLPHISD